MFYRPNRSLNIADAERALSELLGSEISAHDLDFLDRGYSGAVFRVRVRVQGQPHDLLLKGISDDISVRLHEDVLKPLDLGFPPVLGTAEIGGEQYLVMRFIPHEPPDWNDLGKYRRAVQWLARKDRSAEENLHWIAQLDYIEPFVLEELASRMDLLRHSLEELVGPTLAGQFMHASGHNAHRYAEAGEFILQGSQTVTHNDFQMLNVLFATHQHEDRVYVVDWTYPAIGSVCIDLATLLHVCPSHFRQPLIDEYLDARGLDSLGASLPAAQMHVHLSLLQWMANAIHTGQGHAVHRHKAEELVRHLIAYFLAHERLD